MSDYELDKQLQMLDLVTEDIGNVDKSIKVANKSLNKSSNKEVIIRHMNFKHEPY